MGIISTLYTPQAMTPNFQNKQFLSDLKTILGDLELDICEKSVQKSEVSTWTWFIIEED